MVATGARLRIDLKKYSSPIQNFGSIFMTDLSLAYYGDSYTITVGGMNIFDEYPDKDSISD